MGYVLYKLFKIMEKRWDHTQRIPIFGLTLCFLLAWAAEDIFGIADITGAYVAGIILCNTNNSAYIDRKIYDGMKNSQFGYRHIEYVLETRKPVDDIYQFILDHKEHIENLNVVFEHQEDRTMMREVLAKIPDTTLTTAFDNNLELGGATTSKAAALQELENDGLVVNYMGRGSVVSKIQIEE